MPLVDILLVETCFGSSGSVVTIGLVDVSFFGSEPEGGGFVGGEVESGDGDFVGFEEGGGVVEGEGFLLRTKAGMRAREGKERVRMEEEGKDKIGGEKRDESSTRRSRVETKRDQSSDSPEVEPTCPATNYTPSHPYCS